MKLRVKVFFVIELYFLDRVDNLFYFIFFKCQVGCQSSGEVAGQREQHVEQREKKDLRESKVIVQKKSFGARNRRRDGKITARNQRLQVRQRKTASLSIHMWN